MKYLEMALFIPVEGDVEVISRTQIAKKVNSYVSLYPRQMKLDSVKGKSGRVYFFDMYVDEEGLVNGSLSNWRASLLANPLKPNFILGNAVIVPYSDKMKYTEADFSDIYYGVCVEDDESNVELVEENIKSRKRRKETIAKVELTLNEPRLHKGYSSEELRALCRELGLQISGTKNALCERILEELQ